MVFSSTGSDFVNIATLLVLSDPHFGRAHRHTKPEGYNFIPEHDMQSAVSLLAQDLETLRQKHDVVPDILVVAGDFTSIASEDEFHEATDFLKELIKVINALRSKSRRKLGFPRGKLKPEDVWLIPGNHDVSWEEKKPKLRFDRYARFWDEIYSFLGRKKNISKRFLNVEPDHIFYALRSCCGLSVLGLNSCELTESSPDEPILKRIGFVSKKQLKASLDEFEGCARSGDVRIALMHHHPFVIPPLSMKYAHEYDAMHFSGSLLSALKRHRFDVLVHGHMHYPTHWVADYRPFSRNPNMKIRRPMLIISPGSLSVQFTRRLDNIPNFYYLLKLHASSTASGGLFCEIQGRLLPEDSYPEDTEPWREHISEVLML